MTVQILVHFLKNLVKDLLFLLSNEICRKGGGLMGCLGGRGRGAQKYFGLSNQKEFVKIKSSTCNEHFLFLPVNTILTPVKHDMFVQLQYPFLS